MIVHGYFRSSAAHRLRIAMNLKRLEYGFRSVHLRRGDQKTEASRDVPRLLPELGFEELHPLVDKPPEIRDQPGREIDNTRPAAAVGSHGRPSSPGASGDPWR